MTVYLAAVFAKKTMLFLRFGERTDENYRE